ncbi:MAG TPA: glycosidase, partial [Candidatus Dormibacteraeota bacterium]|nr:glycosidase [Candidatus Dormibacteraeota bacterium]
MIVALTIVAYLPAGSLTASVPATAYGPSDPNLPWLRTDNGQIVDQQGRKVLLRGFNADALVAYPKDPPASLDEMDARLMQLAGFDVVRLGIDWSQLEPT